MLKLESSEDELFSVSAAVLYLAPVSEENTVAANSWLEWDATQLQVNVVLLGNHVLCAPFVKTIIPFC